MVFKKMSKPQRLLSWVLAFLAVMVSAEVTSAEVNYGGHPNAKAFVDRMVAEHDFERSYVQKLMQNAEKKQSILDAIARPAEKTKTWGEYRRIFITDKRINRGIAFMEEHKATLERAERDFGVPTEIIAAIIGVETFYGRHKGGYRVLDALATLGFDYSPRGKFFTKQLEEYLLLVREQKFDALEVKGSYAGAMGFGQFIPSSYRHYAIDFDGDGVADIVNNPVDAIGSVANYFKSHGWRQGEQVTVMAQVADNRDQSLENKSLKPDSTVAELIKAGFTPSVEINTDQPATAIYLLGDSGDEYWLGLQNFYVITRYNHSRLYAMAVYQLSEALKAHKS